MNNSITSANYSTLEDVARRFSEEQQRIHAVQASVNEHVQRLRAGGWDADAAHAWFAMMGRDVMPSIERLATALGQAEQTTREIARLLYAAEEEAAACLPCDAADDRKDGVVLYRLASFSPSDQHDPSPEPPAPSNPVDDILASGFGFAFTVSMVNPGPGYEDLAALAIAGGTLVLAGLVGAGMWLMSQINQPSMSSGQAGESAANDGQAGANPHATPGAPADATPVPVPVPTPATLTGGQTYTTPGETDWHIDQDKVNQAGRRGWDEQTISDTIDNPADTGTAVDRSTGDPATAYYGEDGHYVVRNDVTGRIIQVSDRGDSGWIDDTDPSNPRPITPRQPGGSTP